MTRNPSMLLGVLLTLAFAGAGAAQEPEEDPGDDAPAHAEAAAAEAGPFRAEMWVAVRPGATLGDAKHEVAASTVPALYHIHWVKGSGSERRYWLAGDVSGWAREADILAHEDTLRALAILIRRCPRDPAPYLARGLVELGIGRFRPAIGDFDDVLRLDPWCANAYYYRALANREIRERDRALGDLYEAIRLRPDNPAFYFARAVVEGDGTHRLRAIEDYTMTLRLDPTNEAAKEALDRLVRQPRPAAPATNADTGAEKKVESKSPASDEKKTKETPPPPKTPLQVALEQAAIEEANARAAEARAKLEGFRARIEEARARAEKAMLDAERYRRERTGR